MAIIKQGGQLERIKNSKGENKLELIKFRYDGGENIEMWINEDSVTYIDINEALAIKKELFNAIKDLILSND